LRVASQLNPYRLARGKVLVSQGDKHTQDLWLLRSGTLGVHCVAPSEDTSKAAHKSTAQNLGPLKAIISEPGQLVGLSCSVLGEAEPASVVVQSALGDAFCVPWPAMSRLLPIRVVEVVKTHSRDTHNRRIAQARSTPQVPRSASAHHACSPVAQGAWRTFFDAATSFDIRVPSSKNRVYAVAGHNEADPPFGCEHRMEGEHRKRVQRALEKLEAQLSGEVCSRTERSITAAVAPRPPVDNSAAHLQAEIFYLLAQDTSEATQHLIRRAMHDLDKADIDRWIERHFLNPNMEGYSQCQDLRLLVRRHRGQPANSRSRHRPGSRAQSPRG